MYINQNYCVHGHCTSSCILKTRNHNILQTGRFILRWEEGREPKECPPSPHLRTETDPVSETLYFQIFSVPEVEQNPKPITPSSVYLLNNINLEWTRPTLRRGLLLLLLLWECRGKIIQVSCAVANVLGSRGSVVVKALCYKPEGCGF
jgi:hypothetical protein